MKKNVKNESHITCMHMRRIPTGGPLNWLNEKSRCNSRANSVPIMSLLESHPTDDSEVLKKCIEEHAYTECECGIKSKGPVEKFALSLFEAQFSQWATEWRKKNGTFSYDDCLKFQHALFCEAPIRGRLFEMKSRSIVERLLKERYPAVKTRKATLSEDLDMGVDYMVYVPPLDDILLGIQVKPHSAMQMMSVLRMHTEKHKKCQFPVLFHVYHSNGKFDDIDGLDTIASLSTLSSSPTL